MFLSHCTVLGPHIAIIGGTGATADYDLSLVANTSSTWLLPWTPEDTNSLSATRPVGMLYNNGFLVCGGGLHTSCKHLPLGGTEYDVEIPGYTTARVRPSGVEIEPGVMWVLGGRIGATSNSEYPASINIFTLSGTCN